MLVLSHLALLLSKAFFFVSKAFRLSFINYFKRYRKLNCQLSVNGRLSGVNVSHFFFEHLSGKTLYWLLQAFCTSGQLLVTNKSKACHSSRSLDFALFFSYRYVIFRLRKAFLLPFVQKERLMASTSDLSPAERQRFIMNWLAEKPNISVSDIVRRFSVSEVTARHDLVSLESEGKLRRVRGGAVSLSRSNAISYPEERINVQVEAKEAIAATAATLVDDGDVLVIDIGTTAFYFTKALMDKRDITIITGDLAIANYASFNLPNASVVLLGGSVRKGHLYLAGALTLDCMSKLHADKAFVSADGFHPDHGFTVEHDFSAMIKSMYLTNSNQGYMMVDQGKFNKTSFYQSAQIDDLDGIIVDGDNEGIMTAAIESSRSHPKLYFAK
ncbi:MAG: DeoR/GlpR family DNA-binding transcription regulator [Collinsella sp.]